MPEMNHGTKGDYVARNSINDRSVTWRERALVLCLNFCHLSEGPTSHRDERPNAILRPFQEAFLIF